ncbi:MAG: 1-deoxy-D-xylulose-5-phosphate synthase [Prevotellaceae bacterium]|jgi:1-deoxy-D-xylulose-5-phosphate synthase|nr:1-deoxy-D-xylulose-5-phosphate synthase [Prevotellaceae bacterium]
MQNILNQIDSPEDVRYLNESQLIQLSQEIREFIIDQCAANPGHFGASLGAVELAVALHYSYNTPYDKIVWDVGHQAYAHKILTGRRDAFTTNRKLGGISGFPRMSESEYDAFGVGHASTSISAALGIAEAAHLNKEDRHVVAVIGDGAMTGGLAFEGLNNTGWLKPNMLVILNDNDMAIDPNVGSLKEYLAKLTLSGKYNQFKKSIWNFLGKNNFRTVIQRFENSVKSAALPGSNIFETLGFRYFGPIDGNSIFWLTNAFKRIKNIEGPCFLHVVTKKGKGYKLAEESQTEWHAPGKFNKETGQRIIIKSDKPTPSRYQDVFGETIVELAKKNDKILGITPAMPTGSSLNIMMEEIPDRAFDVGIAEGHAVTFSAGLAAGGYLPFCNIYSSFMQRAYDNVIHDVALQNLNVVFCLDRGGIVGEDGATHHGVFDLAYFRCIPNMIVSSPMNEVELRNLMYTAQLPGKGPFSIRYPRGGDITADWHQPFKEVPIGKARILKDEGEIAVLSIGSVGNDVIKAIKQYEDEGGTPVAHYDMRFVKPIDEELLHKIGKRFSSIITVENGTIIGGLGSAVAEFFTSNKYNVFIKRLGVPDHFVEHGTPAEIHTQCGFDVNGIYKALKELI